MGLVVYGHDAHRLYPWNRAMRRLFQTAPAARCPPITLFTDAIIRQIESNARNVVKTSLKINVFFAFLSGAFFMLE